MAEEKSQKVMLTMSNQLKEKLEKRADAIGVPITQYIMSLIVSDVKKPISKD